MTNINPNDIDSEFFSDNIPKFSTIQVIFVDSETIKNNKYINKFLKNKTLTFPDFWEQEENFIEVFELRETEDNSYMVAEQSLAKNSKLMEMLFKNRVPFQTKELDITTYNTILYQG